LITVLFNPAKQGERFISAIGKSKIYSDVSLRFGDLVAVVAG
jgi:hypothetical protein